jgi:hypothetical protein
MAYQPSFVAAVLAGFEDTIAHLREGAEDPQLLSGLEVLDNQVRSLRVVLEPEDGIDNEPESSEVETHAPTC